MSSCSEHLPTPFTLCPYILSSFTLKGELCVVQFPGYDILYVQILLTVCFIAFEMVKMYFQQPKWIWVDSDVYVLPAFILKLLHISQDVSFSVTFVSLLLSFCTLWLLQCKFMVPKKNPRHSPSVTLTGFYDLKWPASFLLLIKNLLYAARMEYVTVLHWVQRLQRARQTKKTSLLFFIFYSNSSLFSTQPAPWASRLINFILGK